MSLFLALVEREGISDVFHLFTFYVFFSLHFRVFPIAHMLPQLHLQPGEVGNELMSDLSIEE